MKNTELTLDAVREGLSLIPSDDRDLWVKIAMALKDEFGDEAKDAWLDWSSGAKNYDAAAAGDVWKSVKSGKVTIASFIYEAKQFGWKPRASHQRRVAPEEYARRQAERERRRAEEEAEDRAKAERAARRATDLWGQAKPATDHPYLARKGIKPHGARLLPVWERRAPDPQTGEIVTVSVLNALVVPIFSGPRTLTSLQAIFPATNDILGRDKDYLPYGHKQGCYYVIGEITRATLRIIFCEGFATGASLHEATGCPVVVCFDAGNLQPVAESVRAKLPDVEIIVAGDNDLWTKGNPGARKANAAAFAVHGRMALPIFADYTGEPTDFNDLRDPDEIRAQIDQAVAAINPEHYDPQCRWQPPAAAEPQPEVGAREDDTPSENTGSGPSLTISGDETAEQEPLSGQSAPTDPDGELDDDIDARGYFKILGYDHDRYFVFQHERKQLAVYTGGSFTDSGFIALAPLQFWEINFPADSGFNKRAAMNWFIRTAHSKGIFDPSHSRGRGAWVDRGRVVLHLGNKLVVDGEATEITAFSSRYVYELDRSLPALSTEPMTADEGEELLATAMMFRWIKPASAPMLAGWCALAPLCGALRWRPHVWLTGGAGCGKALPHSAGILTPTGWSTMGEARVGDLVTTPDNGFARIMGVYPQGRIPVFKLTFADGRTVRASGDHLWKVRVKHNWRLRTTDEMREILSRETRASRSLAIPLAEPLTITGNNKQRLPLHPYVLGIMLGDGQFANVDFAERQRGSLLTCFDPDIVNRARGFLEGEDGTFFDTNVEGRYRFGDLSKYGHKTRETVKELRLLGTVSETKFVPRAYLEASIEERIELLKGLMDTDGFAGEGGAISYCTTSPQLRDDVVELVRSLGGIASASEKHTSFTYQGEKRHGRLAYNISIRFRDPTIAFSLPRKLARVSAEHQYSDCLYLNVISIDPDGEEECSCIAVDHPDRLYVTDEFVVTHNTTVLNEYVYPLMNGMSIFAQGNSTEAGIRQTLKKDALPVLFDESEKNNERERQRVDGVLALIRQASTESAAQTLKGSANGESMAFHIRSMFCLASIQVGMEHQADYERLAVLALRPKRDGEEVGVGAATWEAIKERLYRLKRDEDLPARLFRRSLNLLPTTLKNIEVFATAAADKFGSQRDGDQYGTLMAGAWSLIRDTVATPEEAREYLDLYDWQEYMDHTDSDDSVKALSAVLGAHVRMPSGLTVTVHELLLLSQGIELEGVGGISSGSAEAMLGRYGIKIEAGEVLFANSCTALHGLVSHTPYSADLKGQLMRVRGARRFDRPIYVSGITSRAVAIPLEPLKAGVKNFCQQEPPPF